MDHDDKIAKANEILDQLGELELDDSELDEIVGGRGGIRKGSAAGRDALRDLLGKLGGKGFRDVDSSVV